MSLVQPIGQKRLTNIAVVKYRKCGKRFEIACYKNKVLNWRNGVEKDLDEVLQTTAVFSNVSKGVLAKKEDVQAAFGTTDEQSICLLILKEGQLQVSDKERKVALDSLFRDVASILSEKCVNPTTGRPYTASMIERALKDAHFSVDPNKRAKQQAREALRLLESEIPIQRARMRLKLTAPAGSSSEEILALLKEGDEGAVVEACDLIAGGSVTIICQVDPGMFRQLNRIVQEAATSVAGGGSKSRIEVLDLAVVSGDAQDFDSLEAPLPATGAGQQQQQQQRMGSGVGAASSGLSGYVPAAAPRRAAADDVRAESSTAASAATVVYPRGPIAQLPEEHASRRDRFEELDELQPGWTVELRERGGGGVVDALLFSPTGVPVGAYANARRMALAASKATAAAEAGSSSGAAAAAAGMAQLKV